MEAICLLLLQCAALDDDGDKDHYGDGCNYAYGNGCTLSKLSNYLFKILLITICSKNFNNYLFKILLMTTNIVTCISENFDGQNDNDDNDLVILIIMMSC